MPLHRLTAITIGVPNLEASREFYRDFGLAETAPGRFSTADGGEQLRLVAAPRRDLLELGLGVDDPDDLDHVASRLARLDVPAVREADRVFTNDPVTGLRIVVSIAERIVQRDEPAPAVNRPGRAERCGARASAVLRDQATRPRKLGHVVMGSTDAALSRRFLVDGLGFKVSDELPDVSAAFLRCSTDHHNFLVQQAPLDVLHHTAWEVDDVDEIGRGASRLVASHPERHVWGLGRHAIGSNFFWYFRDPAGNLAEYYSDLDVIDDDAQWKPAAWSGMEGLKSWGPEVPLSFLAPDDLAERMRAEAR